MSAERDDEPRTVNLINFSDPGAEPIRAHFPNGDAERAFSEWQAKTRPLWESFCAKRGLDPRSGKPRKGAPRLQ